MAAKLQELSDYQGDTWILDLIQVTVGGVAADLTGVDVTGTIAGVDVSSFTLAPEPGIDVRVIVDAADTELAVVSSTPYLSEVIFDFPDGTRKRKTFNFTVLSGA
jgi:hypothetical protein